jgi:hypothetical protein
MTTGEPKSLETAKDVSPGRELPSGPARRWCRSRPAGEGPGSDGPRPGARRGSKRPGRESRGTDRSAPSPARRCNTERWCNPQSRSRPVGSHIRSRHHLHTCHSYRNSGRKRLPVFVSGIHSGSRVALRFPLTNPNPDQPEPKSETTKDSKDTKDTKLFLCVLRVLCGSFSCSTCKDFITKFLRPL